MRQLLLTVMFLCAASMATASGKPAGVGNSDHVDTWHGTGSGHQANNEPGDTAADRHGFNNATAGNSGKTPAAGDRAGQK